MTSHEVSANNHPVILFDGVCNLCNGVVQFVLKNDKQQIFRFASLQSSFGEAVLNKFHLPADNFSSFILLDKGRIYTKSTAALRVARQLPAAWSLLYGLMLIPPFIRNAVYDFVASNRYKWFGRRDKCFVPSTEIKSRFFN